MMSLIPAPWDEIRATEAQLAECRALLRQIRGRLVSLLRHAGGSLDSIGRDAGVCRQRAAQWEAEQ